ncbi:hypothetical protein ACTA71_012370 [Dictyostelium dimigraforme]
MDNQFYHPFGIVNINKSKLKSHSTNRNLGNQIKNQFNVPILRLLPLFLIAYGGSLHMVCYICYIIVSGLSFNQAHYFCPIIKLVPSSGVNSSIKAFLYICPFLHIGGLVFFSVIASCPSSCW